MIGFVNRYISRLLCFIVLKVILLLSWFLPEFLYEWVLFFSWTKWKRMLSRLMRAQDQSILWGSAGPIWRFSRELVEPRWREEWKWVGTVAWPGPWPFRPGILHLLLGPIPRDLDSIRLGGVWKVCLSSKFQSNSDAARLGTTLWEVLIKIFKSTMPTSPSPPCLTLSNSFLTYCWYYRLECFDIYFLLLFHEYQTHLRCYNSLGSWNVALCFI